MTETGKIRTIQGNIVTIVPDRSSACFGCMNHECKNGEGFLTAENPAALPLKQGQTVEVKAPGVPVGQTLIVLLPPILGFIAGFFLARLLFPEAGEGAFAGMGVIFLFAAAFIVYKARRKKAAAGAYTVTRIIE